MSPPSVRSARRSARACLAGALALALGLLVGACSDSGGDDGGVSVASCTAYVTAINGCYSDAAVTGSDLDPDSTCSGVDVGGVNYSDYYDCLAAVYDGTDCADLAAFGAIDTSSCTF